MKDAQKPDETKPSKDAAPASTKDAARESGGPKGPEPTRFGDWERNGKCVDF